jgi:hypothetical protein
VSRSSSGFVAGLTAAALAAVGFLAYRASATVPADLGGSHASGAPAASTSKAPGDQRKAVALPAGSGTDERVVYSLGADRVWLVDAGDHVNRTYKVTPGSVDPPLGTYWVSSRSSSVTGTDGTPIEHVVRFTLVGGVTIGFSAAVNGTTPSPDPATPTGGIRQTRADGDAMWQFATIGQKIVVIR